MKWNDDENDALTFDRTDDASPWLSLERNSFEKRAVFPFKSLPQRRNNRPHWNPLVAAYKRCGELLAREDRESCFKNAIQMLFVHKLRK